MPSKNFGTALWISLSIVIFIILLSVNLRSKPRPSHEEHTDTTTPSGVRRFPPDLNNRRLQKGDHRSQIGQNQVQSSAPLSERYPRRLAVDHDRTTPNRDGIFHLRWFAETDLKFPYIHFEQTRKISESGVSNLLNEVVSVANQVIVKVRSHLDESALKSVNGIVNGKLLRRIDDTTYLFELNETHLNAVDNAIQALQALDDGLVYAEPNFVARIAEDRRLPEDPLPSAWASLEKIHAPEAWVIETGSEAVRVGIIDTGVDGTISDLAPNMWTHPGESGLDDQGELRQSNGIDDDGNGFVDDFQGWDFFNEDNDPTADHEHGTSVARIVGAASDNGGGFVGVAWNVALVPIKAFNWRGYGFYSDIVPP